MADLIELDRRISRAISRGRGLQLSDEELDILVSVGALEVLKAAAAEALKIQAEQRQRERSEYRAERTSALDEAELKRQGEIALARVQRVLRPKGRVPRSALTKTEPRE